MSNRLKLVAATVLLLAGAVLALLATDVVRWQSRMRSGDTRFAFVPGKRDLWTPSQLVPLGAAKALLGLDDDLAYRRAVRAFVNSQPREIPYSDTDVVARRGQAQELLAEIADGTQDPKRRAAASNLIGALGFANAALDPSQATTYLSNAVESFRQAISLDPANADAKYNLELALDRLKTAERESGQQPPPRDTRGGTGSGAGTGEPGTGY
jgi:hypothetical protein